MRRRDRASTSNSKRTIQCDKMCFGAPMRTEAEIITDRLLLLHAVKQANKHGCMEGTFKLQKIPFASQLAMNQEAKKGFNYSFFRFTHGPISKEIYDDGGVLHSAGLITTLKGPIKLTDAGAKLYDSLHDVYAENLEILAYIDFVAKSYASLTFGSLKKKIYDLTVDWGGDKWKVGEIPEYTDVLTKLESEEAKSVFKIDDDWIDSLWGSLHYTAEQSRKLQIVHKVAS